MKKQLSFRRLALWLLILILVMALLACNLTSAVTPTVTVPSVNTNQSVIATAVNPAVVETATTIPIVHTLKPGDPPNMLESNLTDRDSSVTAAQHRANGGDNFITNLYERPFNTKAMDTYFPDLDITMASLGRDSQWVYVTIKLIGQNQSGGLVEDYGVELDLNVDGRGDVLVMASKPGKDWSTDGVGVWLDKNHDVGGAHPIQSDPPASTDGYETQIFDNGTGTDPDMAWARVSPTDENSVQIAFKRSVINDAGKFTWGAWAISDSMFKPAWFDYNDHFTQAEAGSPLVELTKYYPILALAEVDNTCRWAVGFTPTGDEPGICQVPATPVPPTSVKPSTITGLAWYDYNGDGVKNGTDYGVPGVTIQVHSGSCGSSGAIVANATTNAAGNYSVTIPAGTYCVAVPSIPAPASRSSGSVQVTVPVGGSATADFRFWTYIG